MSKTNARSMFKNPLLYGVMAFLFVLIITQFVAFQKYQLHQKTKQQEIEQQVSKLKVDLQNVLGQSFNVTQTLAFMVEHYGIPDNFDSVAQLLLNSNNSIDALELVNDKGIITHVHPLKGNEVIGLNILDDPDNKFGAKTTLEKKDYYTAGPIYFRQGGSGIIGRRPLFKNGKFNGFVAAVVRLSTVLNAIQLDSTENEQFSYQLVKINLDKTEETFYASKNISKAGAITLPLTTSQGEWKLYVYLNNSYANSSTILFSVLGILLSLVCGLLSWFLMRQPSKLNRLVDEKTALLKESKERYKLLIEGASDGIFLIDFKGNIVDANPYALQMFGYTKEDLLRKNLLDLTLKKDTVKRPPRYKQMLEGKTVRSEQRLIKKDGSIFYGEVSAKKLNNKTILGIVRDVTERKELEIAAEENLVRFAKAYNNRFVGMVIRDHTNRFVDANPYFLKLIGYSLEEIKGKSIKELGLINIIEASKSNPAINLLDNSEQVNKLEVDFIAKNGNILHLITSKEPYEYLGENYSLSTYVDQTDAKKADQEKQRLISIIENSPGFIGLATLIGEPLFLNDAGKKMLDLPCDFDIKNSTIFDFFEESYKNVIVNEHLPTIMEKGLWTGEVPLKNFKTKNITPLEFSGFLIKDKTTNKPIAIGSIGFDLTERKENQKAILELQSKMDAAIRIGKIGYWDFDTETNTYICSPLIYDIYNISPDTVLTIPVLESLIHPDDLEMHRQNLREIVKDKSNHAFTYRIIVTDGSIKYLMVDIEVARDDDNRAIDFKGTVIDVTKQKEADFEILDLQSKMNAAIRIGNIGYWHWNMTGNIVEWSKEMYAMHEVDPNTKMTPELVRKIIYHEDVIVLDTKLEEKKGESKSTPSNYRIQLKDNSFKYFLAFSEIIYDDNGDPIVYHGTAMDITKNVLSELALKESQEKFSKAFQTNLMGMLILDEQRQVIDANKMVYNILETSKERLLGKTILESKEIFIDENERERLWKKLVEEGEILNEEYKVQLKSGVKKTLLISIAPLYLKGEISYLVNIFDDSKRKEAESNLEAQFHELQKTNSELDSFVYSASHELRAPLSSVLGLIQLIQMEDINPKLFQHLNMMEKSIERLDDFIKDIIEYSRNKHLALKIESINFTILIEHSIESLWYLENTQKINIEINVEDKVDFVSDSKRISVLLNNFISNAIKYHDISNDNAAIWIDVKTTKKEAVLIIKDNGVGMAEHQLEKIFEMFYRVSSKVMGSGIGLFIVKEVLSKLNGTIDVQSKIGKGSTFTLRIPNESGK
ncbi:PAS domain S-box-containing protein [Maribacter caenipelagi]|uniref:histidine kinase n=1 Tax=Maribacter caenipelagi TaxID=1447781 RepID=A0A4R7DE14_9FLAO|nr:PAS domain S-box protein [Maribacter caenipelagi]TDS18591.1 PAS domain S-box-containing protein [Maribacter caenipelagi]